MPTANELLGHILTKDNLNQLSATMLTGWHAHRITIDLVSDSIVQKAFMHIYLDEDPNQPQP